jgi:hypothetical protein
MRKLTVRRRWAMESLTKQTITLKEIVVLSNSIAGGMDAAEGAFTWNYTVWGYEEEELEELFSGQLGIISSDKGRMLDSIVVANDPCRGQRAWLQIGGGTTICSRKMRETHLPHVYVEWEGPADGRMRRKETTPRPENQIW